MQNRSKKLLWLSITLLAAGVIGWLIFGNKSTGAAENYKAALRAKGEKITFVDLGFPKPPEDGRGLSVLTNAIDRIRMQGFKAGSLTYPTYPSETVQGRQRVLWQGAGLPSDQSTNLVTWAEISASLTAATNELTEIRAAVEQPMRCFLFNPGGYSTNQTLGLKYPFVEMRTASQCLYVDGIEALHAGDLARVRQDHHALILLADYNREDPTLVAAMIRVAIAGLNLQLTWQAMQHTNWTEADLATMQRDWERLELLESVENGFMGERAFTEMAFNMTRARGLGWVRQSMRLGTPPNPWENIRDSFMGVFWDADEDELLALRHHQQTLDSIRALRSYRAWSEVDAAIKRQHQALDKAIGSGNPMNRFRFQLSAIVIPNTSKAIQTTVRHETQRRLTVTAMALKRYQLRFQGWPEKLDQLVPDFLAAVPLDLMDARPLRYRRESDAEFVLYSIGEDCKDDGGSLVPVGVAAQNNFWAMRDFVWPKPED